MKKKKKKKMGEKLDKFQKNSVANFGYKLNNTVLEYKTFSATKILREIKLDRLKISKRPFLTILKAMIFFNFEKEAIFKI